MFHHLFRIFFIFDRFTNLELINNNEYQISIFLPIFFSHMTLFYSFYIYTYEIFSFLFCVLNSIWLNFEQNDIETSYYIKLKIWTKVTGKQVKIGNFYFVVNICKVDQDIPESFQIQMGFSFPFLRANDLCSSLLNIRASIFFSLVCRGYIRKVSVQLVQIFFTRFQYW